MSNEILTESEDEEIDEAVEIPTNVLHESRHYLNNIKPIQSDTTQSWRMKDRVGIFNKCLTTKI